MAKPRIRVRADGTIPRQVALIGYSSQAYEAGRSDSRELGRWQPPLATPDAETLGARDKIVARSRDMDRNNPWVSGGVDTRTDAVVGPRIRLEARPDFEAMGRTPEWAEGWAVKTEAEYRIWGGDHRRLCDVERDLSFGGLVKLAYIHYAIDGEACAAIYDLDRGGDYETAVRVIDPDLLSNKENSPDTDFLRGGVHLDTYGAATAYDIRVRHLGDVNGSAETFRWETIQRESDTGRPLFIHVKNKRRAGQHRSVSALASGLKRFKMLERYDNAALEAALWDAINAFVIESPFSDDEVGEAFAPADDEQSNYVDKLVEYRKDKRVHIGGGVQALHLFPGEKGKKLASEHPNGNFEAFQGAVLRSLASRFKLSHQQLSQDWSSINYSSARTLLNEVWRGLNNDRYEFAQAFCTPIYAAWLEEAVARGRIKVPGGPLNFYRWRAALTMAEWIGPGRGTIDPQKEATAGDMNLAANRQSLQQQCAEQGVDVREVMLQRSREIAMAKRFGLPEPMPVRGAPNDAHPDAADHQDALEAA